MNNIPNLQYKQRLDEQGNFKSLEIHQNGQFIVISLGSTVYGDGTGNTKWDTIKETINRIQERTKAEVHPVSGKGKK
jgi:hypothetical protein